MAAARPESNGSLSDLLADALPHGAKFTFYHVSTPPTKCAAIFSAPPGARAERTYCESHFLNVSIAPGDAQQEKETAGEVLIFAIEVLIYTTSHLTTIFVSKADSTGYLSLLDLPRSGQSPIRAISTTFIAWLVKHRQRPATRLVVSLFARAQDQYLFPGSIENSNKHVADDTALVKWWCKVLDPVLREYTPEAVSKPDTDSAAEQQQPQATTAQGHLIIPGFERNDTLRFFPPTVRADPPEQKRWQHGHPLLEISRHPSAPPRCLIPHFPDDPKSRYMDELDDELPDGGNATVTSPSRGNGQWRSVRSLAQFWEMMSFRQECSSGRLVGFIWVLFTPADVETTTTTASDASSDAGAATDAPVEHASLASMLHDQPPPRPTTPPKKRKRPTSSDGKKSASRSPRRKQLSGPIFPRLPRIKSNTSTSSNPDTQSSSADETSKHYTWPPSSRGQLVLDEKHYKRATELLLHHNFAARDIAEVSTRKWVDEVGVLGSTRRKAWGVAVVGRAVSISGGGPVRNGQAHVNTLNVGMVRKKRKDGAQAPADEAGVNTLSAGLVRKKPKTGEDGPAAATVEGGAVNVLSSGLVRKKPKA
ncbi:Histone acetyltransferase [Neofusicoccum parvum]|uniref:Histone acetyltransferase n=1 Tax=Neofusicoccum parvum TaxID=310453 RepID=A0ACB5SB62_9PEZI|nr:Histone acetyltransferase [Neofusicoccum parvum]